MGHPVKISATIITLNEEKKIERCLQSLQGVADEVIVLDSFSIDATQSICARYNVKFIQHKFEGYVNQKNLALGYTTYDHVLSLDADECLSPELITSILEVKKNWGDEHGFSFNRLNNYCGQWIRHCGWYPDRKVRLWNKQFGRWGGTDPHDKVLLNEGKIRRLKGDLLHYAYFTLDEHLQQMYRFAEVAAKAKYKEGKRANLLLHVIINPLFKFFRKYILQLGFLDGYYGFVFCAATAGLNFYKYLRLFEYNRKGLPINQHIG
jgi:glycosyltransferase involved in cell wall biosynthesis